MDSDTPHGNTRPASIGATKDLRDPLSGAVRPQAPESPLVTRQSIQSKSQNYTDPSNNVGQAAGPNDELAIEKECIAKARAIVERTANDPYTETKEIAKVKAVLLKRRYDKDLKLSER